MEDIQTDETIQNRLQPTEEASRRSREIYSITSLEQEDPRMIVGNDFVGPARETASGDNAGVEDGSKAD